MPRHTDTPFAKLFQLVLILNSPLQSKTFEDLDRKIKRLQMQPATFRTIKHLAGFHQSSTAKYFQDRIKSIIIFVNPNDDSPTYPIIIMIVRVSLVASCPMFLALFPFDEQTCPLSIASCKLSLSLSLLLSVSLLLSLSLLLSFSLLLSLSFVILRCKLSFLYLIYFVFVCD